MNILVVCDIPNWAIGKLADIYIKGNPQFNFKSLYVHPRDAMLQEKIDEFRNALPWADIVIMEYWNTARQLAESVPEMKVKKCILMHHNQKDLLSANWSFYQAILSHTKKADGILRNAGYTNTAIIPYGIDFKEFPYLEKYPANEEKLIGYAGRIVPWKNIKEVSRCAFELGKPLLFMGKMDKLDYWNSIPQEHRDNVDMSFMNSSDEERYSFYHQLSVFVNFCSDGREEGTLPLLEAMACGIPVVTTASGTAADIIEDGKNGLVVPFDDYEALKTAVNSVLEDKEFAEELRKNAWDTIRNMTPIRMARNYSSVIHQVYSSEPLVSIIVPVHEANQDLEKLMVRCNELTHEHKELIICDDSGGEDVKSMVELARKLLAIPIKHIKTSKNSPDDKSYNLAQARNLGVIEAEGEYLLFCDSRLLPEVNCIEEFMREVLPKSWIFGDKGAMKANFVENFSFIRREDLIALGMFNERINKYGGMSQELRERMMRQEYKTGFLPSAKAVAMRKSGMSPKKRYDIVEMKDLLWKIGLFKH